MTREVSAVIGGDDVVVSWSAGSGAAVPDSRDTWTVMWAHRATLRGVAHTHPGGGVPAPSHEDVTTFAACEAGLGRRLTWWIASSDHVIALQWTGPSKTDYGQAPPGDTPWLDELRDRSGMKPRRTP